MVDVFEQVEEELRSDRYKRLARTWLPVVGVVLVVALVGALGWWGWDSYQTGRAAKGAEAYDRGLEAMRENKPADARAAFEQAAEQGNAAYKALALARLQHGKTAEARSALVVLQLGQNVPDAIRQQAQAAIALIDSGTAAALPGIINAAKAAPPPSNAAAEAAPAAPAQQ